jgi:hypothetical protein
MQERFNIMLMMGVSSAKMAMDVACKNTCSDTDDDCDQFPIAF